jgi:hypothetical protein
MPERTYLLTVGIIALIFIVSMTIPFASILIGAVLLRHARWKEIVLVSSLGSATGGNRRLVLALKSGWSIRKRWRSSWRKATGLSPPKAIEFAQRWGRRIRNYIALDSKVVGIELAAHSRRSFNSTNREPIVRQQRRRRFYPRIFVSRI